MDTTLNTCVVKPDCSTNPGSGLFHTSAKVLLNTHTPTPTHHVVYVSSISNKFTTKTQATCLRNQGLCTPSMPVLFSTFRVSLDFTSLREAYPDCPISSRLPHVPLCHIPCLLHWQAASGMTSLVPLFMACLAPRKGTLSEQSPGLSAMVTTQPQVPDGCLAFSV